MTKSRSIQAVLAAFLLMVGANSAFAEERALWPQPVAAPSKPQSDAEKEEGKTLGRALPVPEILQPTLDAALPDYVPLKNAKLSGTIKTAASDVLPSLVRRWIAGFAKLYPGVKIELNPPFAGSLGAKELVSGSIDGVFVSRELRPDDIIDFQKKFGYPPLSVPISGGTYRHYGFLDAVGFAVHPSNPIDHLSFKQLDAILSTTRVRGGIAIRTWGDLGLTGEWADKPIHVYAIKPWNGFEEFIRQRILSKDGLRGEWREDLNFAPVVFPVAKSIAADPYALGYTGLAYVDAPVKMLALSVEEDGPVIAPSYDAVARADYPLSRLIFLNVNRAPGKPLPPVMAEFIRYILSRQGQDQIRDHAIFIPLRARQISDARALIQSP
jgi:phosphate transport system substrate-binding protein